MEAFIGLSLIVFPLMTGAYIWGRVQEARREWYIEQEDQAAFEWAYRNNRLPTMTRIVDSETGEIIEETIL